MKLIRRYFFVCVYVLYAITIFAEAKISSSITNTGYYKIKDDNTTYKSNTVYANLELVKLLTKIESDKKSIKRGDIFRLKISVDNFYDYDIGNMQVNLTLPQGFSYIDNSVRIKDNEVVNTIRNGKNISFVLREPLGKNSVLKLELSIKTSLSAKEGENSFKTFSQGALLNQKLIYSNESTCKVILEEDDVLQKGTIIGLIYVDSNKNNLYDEGEVTVPNIKVFLENGHFAITDKEGKYSIFGERAITHVARLEKATIPKGGKLVQLDNRYNEKGDSVIIELKRNELYKANFAFIDVDENFLKDVEARKKMNEELMTEIEEVVEKDELLFKVPNTSSGTIKADGYFDDRINSLTTSIEKYEKSKQQELLDKHREKKKEKQESIENLQERLKTLTNDLEIMNLKDGQIVSDVISISIKDKMRNRTDLFLNGKKVSKSFIGINGQSPANELSFYRYDGIKLEPEKNVIEVVSTSPSSQEQKRVVEVIYPVKIEDIELLYDKEKLSNAQAEPIDLKLVIKGRNGNTVRESYFTTIESSSGVWIFPEDLSKDKGLQCIVDDGEQNLKLLPTVFNGEIRFKVKIEDFEKDFKLNLKSNAQNNILTGIIEGKFNFGDKKVDFFQESLNTFKEDSNSDFSYRTAVLSKGNIMGEYDYLITYDNTKKQEDVFYQTAKRDDYYLVFGDDSIKGYEGQSTSKLYLSIIGTNSEHLYGDYDVDWKKDDFDIGNYSRTLNGYKFNYDNDKFKFETFISKTSNVQQEKEIPAKNISGPYYIGNGIVENSEKIEIVAYDPSNLDIPLAVVQAPSYSLDHNTGILYFDTIIPERDKNGNLLYIRITYEVESASGKKYYLYGANASYKITEKFKIGGSYFKDENPEVLYENKSVNMVYEDKTLGKLVVEKGETKNEGVKGDAILVNYTNDKNDKFKTKATYYDSDKGFDNPNSLVKNNARLFLIENTYRISAKDEIAADGFRYENKTELKVTEELVVEFKKAVTESSKIIAGTKYSKVKDLKEVKRQRTVGLKYEWKPVKIEGFTSYLEYEQDIDNRKNKRVAIASEYEVKNKFKLYGKYDFINKIEDTNIIGRYKSSYSKLVGTEYNGLKFITPYLEFRQLSSEKQNKEVAFGFKSDYNYSDKTSISTIFERVQGVDSNPDPNSTNLILSHVYKDSNVRMSVNSLDITDSDRVISILLKNSYGVKFNKDLTFAIKNRYFVQDLSKNKVRDRLLLGVAYRGSDDIYNSLLKYELTYDDQIENDDYTHVAHVINSVHNYQLSEKSVVTFAFGGKYAIDKNSDASDKYLRGLVDINWKYFFNNRIDLGINTAFMADTKREKFYAIGVEGGYKVTENLWLGVGYNFGGFQDRDFYEDDRYRRGVYLRFRLLLHEDMFDRFS